MLCTTLIDTCPSQHPHSCTSTRPALRARYGSPFPFLSLWYSLDIFCKRNCATRKKNIVFVTNKQDAWPRPRPCLPAPQYPAIDQNLVVCFDVNRFSAGGLASAESLANPIHVMSFMCSFCTKFWFPCRESMRCSTWNACDTSRNTRA